MKFNKTIKDIQDNSEFFDIDYNDVLNNFDTDDTDEKDMISMRLSVVNIAFIDAVRGDITRPKFVDRLITIFRKEFLDDIRYRIANDNKENIE
jgi:hypothetical protein